MFNQGRNKAFLKTGRTFRKALNMSSCGFYFKKFSLLRDIMLNLNHNIRCYNQCSIFFPCLKYKLNLTVMNCQNFLYSALVTICFQYHISEAKQEIFTKKEIAPVSIKSIVFNHVGISWMIEIMEQINFTAYK